MRDIKVSTDGGQSWKGTGTPGGQNCKVSFVDAETGWLLTSPNLQLSMTTDGGETWSEIAMPEQVTEVSAISLRTASAGYILASDSTLYTTQDGGESWTSLPLDLGKHEGMQILPHALPSAAIRFFDADNGVVVLSLAGGGKSTVIAMHTSDGGMTWEEESVPASIGVPYLTRDGRFLTMVDFIKAQTLTVLKYTGN